MTLTDDAIGKVKPTNKTQRLFDGGGLYLEISPAGGRWWRFKYRFGGKEKRLSLGTYPDTGLISAREKRDEARTSLAEGVDPAESRKAEKAAKREQSSNKFEVLTREWHTKRPLEILGIDDSEELAYRALLAHRLATVDEVANFLSLSLSKTQRLLDNIESKGLATHSLERPRRYVAAPPRLALEALASQQRAEIDRACLTILELEKQSVSTTDSQEHEQVVELITSHVALGQIYTQMLQSARKEVFGFQRAPMLFTAETQQATPSNVRVRSISDDGYLALPGILDSLRECTVRGEEARIFPNLPVKMLVADRRVGLIPLNTEDPAGGPILLVRSRALLNALYALFELTWERSTPIFFSRTGKLERGESAARLSEAAGHVMSLLAAGLNDKAIAHEAGMSAATVTRRISELMKAFDTRTRFQLGWRAALDAFPERLEPIRNKSSHRSYRHRDS
ncbi:DUF4102 domain-containing protein [Dyella dinghuensis]|uniref:DUF4102 domain-containing protein n=1 Tax=Dyella dinghuensis TaxID=1920169 RepID=A0A3S0QZP8_9GAMM|nr:integrase arm-type DNA-binding domain-containing protein [Dyella dinghuensis]RUL66827.1 DUF4102 domain-containing protein [Dyella dinghuensis]